MSRLIQTCWIITEGIAGTENQCLGLAEALGVAPVVKRVKLRFPWKQLSPWLPGLGIAADSDPVCAPFPDLVIASGRKAIGAALHVKEKNPQTFVTIIQDPKFNPQRFDLVIAPRHDDVTGQNVLRTIAGLHRVTPEKCRVAAEKFPQLTALPAPRVAVLIGGNSRAHRMSSEVTGRIAEQLEKMSQSAFLMITASRRTGEENRQILEKELQKPNIFFWDGTGDNPYFAFLHLADYIIVTEDSVSMTSEALSTGKPVYTLALEGGARRLNLFHEMLQKDGYTRPFTGSLEQWSYTPPNDTASAAEEIIKRMQDKA